MAPVYSNLAVLLIVMSNVGATQTLEEAFATGVLMAKNGGIVSARAHQTSTIQPLGARDHLSGVAVSRRCCRPGRRTRGCPDRNGTETNRNGTNAPPQPRRTKWVEIMPKCANLPHFGTFVCRKRFDPLLHV